MIVSHSQDFLNGVCTNIIHMQEKILKYYGVSAVSYIFYMSFVPATKVYVCTNLYDIIQKN